jgi:hypothetical protein
MAIGFRIAQFATVRRYLLVSEKFVGVLVGIVPILTHRYQHADRRSRAQCQTYTATDQALGWWRPLSANPATRQQTLAHGLQVRGQAKNPRLWCLSDSQLAGRSREA